MKVLYRLIGAETGIYAPPYCDMPQLLSETGPGRRQRLETGMLGSCDDVVLDLLAQQAETLAETGNTDREVAILLRFGLRPAQRFLIHNVELELTDTGLNRGLEERDHMVEIFFREEHGLRLYDGAGAPCRQPLGQPCK